MSEQLDMEMVKKLIAMNIAAEREACAQIADSHKADHEHAVMKYPPGMMGALLLECTAIAKAIRERADGSER